MARSISLAIAGGRETENVALSLIVVTLSYLGSDIKLEKHRDCRDRSQTIELLPHTAVQLIYTRIVTSITHGHGVTGGKPLMNVDRRRPDRPKRAAGLTDVRSLSERKPIL